MIASRHPQPFQPTNQIPAAACAGFCGETEADHAATLGLMRATGYDSAFMFAYSDRERTYAARQYQVSRPWANSERAAARVRAF